MINYSDTKAKIEKTVVILTAYGLWPMLEFELDIIQRELDIGSRVIFLSCFGCQTYCPANNPEPGQKFKKRRCQECTSKVKSGIDWLKYETRKLIVAEYEHTTSNEKKFIYEILTELDDSKKEKKIIQKIVNIEGLDIFEACYSELITTLNQANPDIQSNWTKFRSILEVGLVSYYSAEKILQAFEPDKVIVYNGRISRYRPLMRLAQKNNCNLAVYEYPRSNFQNYIVTINNYSHDIEDYSQLLKNEFDNLRIDRAIYEPIAINWFNKRRDLKLDGAQNVFLSSKLAHISKDMTLPDFWDKTKFNLVFFISSENERMSIEENAKKAPFGQVDAIKILHEKFPEIKYTIRIHPNLYKKDINFLKSIDSLKNLINVKIIRANSSQSSYSLVDAADLILTFGSTIGVEAAFSKKPVINVGVANYMAFDCVAVCKSSEDLINLVDAAIKNDFSKFPSIEKIYLGACAYAYAYLNQGVHPKYIEKNSFFGGYMTRDGKRKKIKANEWFILKNRSVAFFPRVRHLLWLLLNEPSRVKKVSASNLKQKIKNFFYGELPS